MVRLSALSSLGLNLLAAHATHALLSALDLTSSADDGSFSFSLTGPANFSVNTNDFWTGIYYVPSADKSAPVAEYQSSILHDLVEDDSFIPFTVLVTSAEVLTEAVVQQLLVDYAKDDVFTMGFLKGKRITNPL